MTLVGVREAPEACLNLCKFDGLGDLCKYRQGLNLAGLARSDIANVPKAGTQIGRLSGMPGTQVRELPL